MGLKGDFDEVVSEWKNASLLFKFWLIFSTFIASGSIASLSETIFKWKTFFHDGVNFYQEVIRDPIIESINFLFKINLPEKLADVGVFYLLLVSAIIRMLIQFRNNIEAGVSAALGLFIVVIGAYQVFDNEKPEHYVESLIAVYGFSLLTVSYGLFKLPGAAKYYWFFYFIAPFALVGVAGAVNKGLSI